MDENIIIYYSSSYKYFDLHQRLYYRLHENTRVDRCIACIYMYTYIMLMICIKGDSQSMPTPIVSINNQFIQIIIYETNVVLLKDSINY